MGKNKPDILFVTLDSCRYDTFAAAYLPNLKCIGELYRAQSPSHFTFGAHALFFIGFTPGIADRAQLFINPKFAKIFKLAEAGWAGFSESYATLAGRSIVEGFRRKGYLTLGSGPVGWFNPETETGRVLTADFRAFPFPRGHCQLAATSNMVAVANGRRRRATKIRFSIRRGDARALLASRGCVVTRREPLRTVRRRQ